MLFDTDVLIWAFRGNEKAARLVADSSDAQMSVVSYMELLRGSRNRDESRLLKSFVVDLGVRLVPLSENIGHRASVYMEEYGVKMALCVTDALIAGTAAEHHLVLCTGNRKHYQPIKDIAVHVFRP